MTNTVAVESLKEQYGDRPKETFSTLLLNKTDNWLSTQAASHRVCGDLKSEGVAIEWHNFMSGTNGTFSSLPGGHPNSLELCLNLSGEGSLQSAKSRLDFKPLTAFLYASGNHALQIYRNHGERHRFLTINFSSSFLREQLMVCEGAVHTLVSQFVLSGNPANCTGGAVRLTSDHERLVSLLLRPQCAQAACQLRCKGIVLQLMADFLIEPCCSNGSSCDRQKCLALERAQKVIAILERDLAEPPTLGEMGREVGCSPFHLSRQFSQETGMTIPKYLRTLRMRYAAELLKSGKCNVTEVAMAVGYSSLSHFSQAFCQTIGCCPAMYSSSAFDQATTACTGHCPEGNREMSNQNRRSGRRAGPEIDVLLESVR